MKRKIPLLSAILLLIPSVLYAQVTNYFEVVEVVLRLLSASYPVLILIAFSVFLWGMVKFIRSAGDERKREEGKKFIVWGLLALFLIVSVWGITYLIINSWGFGGAGIPPCVNKNGVAVTC